MIVDVLKFLALYLAICGVSTLFYGESDVSRMRLFFYTVLLTPVGGVFYVLYARRKTHLRQYHHRCPRCKYYFTEAVDNCPICKKEGVDLKLTKLEVFYGIRS